MTINKIKYIEEYEYYNVEQIDNSCFISVYLSEVYDYIYDFFNYE